MHTRYTLPLAMLLLAGCAGTANLPAMAPQAEPMKGANRIIVTVDGDAYRTVGQTLTSLGYAIAHSDPDLQTITSEFRAARRGASVQVTAAIRGQEISLRGRATAMGMSAENAMEVELYGQTGSPAMESWNALVAVAQAIGGEILYARDRP